MNTLIRGSLSLLGLLGLAALLAAPSRAEDNAGIEGLRREVEALKREVQSLKAPPPKAEKSSDGGLTLKFKDAGLKIYGFVTLQDDHDTTQSLFEAQGNALISRRVLSKAGAAGDAQAVGVNYAGQHGREILSPRYSRLDVAPILPRLDSGLAASGLFELDFLGNDAPNTNPGAVPAAQTENNYFNFGAVRVRHAYGTVAYKDVEFKFGQTWSPFAWTELYDQPEITVQPTLGKAQQRIAQARLSAARDVAQAWQLQGYAGITRPPAMNAGQPAYHFGARLAWLERKAYEPSTSGGALAPLSAAFSAEFIPVRTVIGSDLGDAQALAAFVPVLASADGKDRTNTLGVGADYTQGAGLGATEFPSLTLGVPAASAAQAGYAVDQGIAGVNQAGNVELIRLRTWRAWGVFSPCRVVTVGGGYAEAAGRNLDRFTPTASATATWALQSFGLAPRLQYYYATLIYDPAQWLRFGAELAQTRVTYDDPLNRFAINNRLQLSVYLYF